MVNDQIRSIPGDCEVQVLAMLSNVSNNAFIVLYVYLCLQILYVA